MKAYLLNDFPYMHKEGFLPGLSCCVKKEKCSNLLKTLATCKVKEVEGEVNRKGKYWVFLEYLRSKIGAVFGILLNIMVD